MELTTKQQILLERVTNLITEKYEELLKTLTDVDLSKVIELEDNTDLSAEAACAGGACEVK